MVARKNGNGSSSKDDRGFKTGLILAGAAAKGPFAAGALKIISRDERFDVRAVAGASSGALNAAVYAAGLRVGKEDVAADLLCDLWKDRATFPRIALASCRRKIIRDALKQFKTAPTSKEIKLRIVASSLWGRRDDFGHLRFERCFQFDTKDFQDPDRIAWMAEVCVASAAVPVVFFPQRLNNPFAPQDCQDLGLHWDGGIVDNAPIGWALKTDEIDHIMVVSSESSRVSHKRYGPWALGRLVTMAINERLSRDLYEAKTFNVELDKLCRLGVDLDRLRPALKWRLLQFVEVRPDEDLWGSLVAGFFWKGLRKRYLASGNTSAIAELARFDTTAGEDSFHPANPPTPPA